MARAQLTHSRLYLAGVAAIVTVVAVTPTAPWTMPVAMVAAAVALFGVPHGALDPLIAQRAGLLRAPAVFFAAYLALAGLVCLSWWAAPTATLIAFLLASIWHFAGDWSRRLAHWQGLAAASGIIALPLLFHPDAVSARFAALVPAADADALVGSLQLPALAATGALAAAAVGAAAARRLSDAAEIASLPLLAWLLEPLAFFVVYFCGLHSPRHLIEITSRERPGRKTALFIIGTVTAITLAGATAAWFAVNGLDVTQRLLRVTFIGLAALTLPHMVLTATYEKRTASHPTQ